MTDKACVAEWLPLFFDTDDILEVRVIDAGGTLNRIVAGYLPASKIKHHAGEIVAISKGSFGGYFTPQKLNPDCLKRCPCRFADVQKRKDKLCPELTCDKDVTALRYLLIDVDAVRAPGHAKDSATDGEREAAGGVADAVKLLLHECGYAPPLEVDSGNGRHLYYRLKSARYADILRLLAHRLDTPEAKIDTGVYNPSRIMKIPGTWARKGVSTATRPHRQCRVLEVPSEWTA